MPRRQDLCQRHLDGSYLPLTIPPAPPRAFYSCLTNEQSNNLKNLPHNLKSKYKTNSQSKWQSQLRFLFSSYLDIHSPTLIDLDAAAALFVYQHCSLRLSCWPSACLTAACSLISLNFTNCQLCALVNIFSLFFFFFFTHCYCCCCCYSCCST